MVSNTAVTEFAEEDEETGLSGVDKKKEMDVVLIYR